MASLPMYFQFTAESNRCLGVAQNNQGSVIGPGAPLQLGYVTDPKVQLAWDYETTFGFIILDFSMFGGQKLAVDFADGKIATDTYLQLRPFTGVPSQRWSLLIRPGYITSLANTTLVIDDHFNSTQADNPIWAHTYNGTTAQQWTPKPLNEFLTAVKPQSKAQYA
ncbi:RICIN domain-containing protein [Paraburkholderia domus]|uniref:Ricin B lectin domain-containing protein n=1 Tax=Paraburkholderia domus TaxID=2793075 RepID=A0A9N8MLD6_9BURK|nr:RICIN domain-containing protein [Paraburkholderia domus]MBK5164843.1 RICIN domain-containing protein [Burkholderia sp. R-70211]CAE6872101.1 hypothetical protein R70211_01328 [Paraburkholderia domus]